MLKRFKILFTTIMMSITSMGIESPVPLQDLNTTNTVYTASQVDARIEAAGVSTNEVLKIVGPTIAAATNALMTANGITTNAPFVYESEAIQGWHFNGFADAAFSARTLSSGIGQSIGPDFEWDYDAKRWKSYWQWGTNYVAYTSDIFNGTNILGTAQSYTDDATNNLMTANGRATTRVFEYVGPTQTGIDWQFYGQSTSATSASKLNYTMRGSTIASVDFDDSALPIPNRLRFIGSPANGLPTNTVAYLSDIDIATNVAINVANEYTDDATSTLATNLNGKLDSNVEDRYSIVDDATGLNVNVIAFMGDVVETQYEFSRQPLVSSNTIARLSDFSTDNTALVETIAAIQEQFAATGMVYKAQRFVYETSNHEEGGMFYALKDESNRPRFTVQDGTIGNYMLAYLEDIAAATNATLAAAKAYTATATNALESSLMEFAATGTVNRADFSKELYISSGATGTSGDYAYLDWVNGDGRWGWGLGDGSETSSPFAYLSELNTAIADILTDNNVYVKGKGWELENLSIGAVVEELYPDGSANAWVSTAGGQSGISWGLSRTLNGDNYDYVITTNGVEAITITADIQDTSLSFDLGSTSYALTEGVQPYTPNGQVYATSQDIANLQETIKSLQRRIEVLEGLHGITQEVSNVTSTTLSEDQTRAARAKIKAR